MFVGCFGFKMKNIRGEVLMTPLKRLEKFGQSVWYDNVSRKLVRGGELQSLVADGVKGVTSNPAIFEKAMGHSDLYDADIRALAQTHTAVQIFRNLAVDDIRRACDIMKPVYTATGCADGFVSIEVSPSLANDTAGTVAEAKSLWAEIGRENLMIKMPANLAGIRAIQAAIAEGINVNATLLFSRAMYAKVAAAYIAGLEERPADCDLSRISSVASFFVSRIDAKVDALLDQKAQAASATDRAAVESLKGKTAIANAKLAYEHYRQIYLGGRWDRLVKRGARPQRMLWASTGTKEKQYSDVLYVEELIGPNTVNTVPPETLAAYRDHGNPANRLEGGLTEARDHMAKLDRLNISLDQITKELLDDGLWKFQSAADSLIASIEAKRANVLQSA
jgi:transaldolase / glucose-6-phosphate isomerase